MNCWHDLRELNPVLGSVSGKKKFGFECGNHDFTLITPSPEMGNSWFSLWFHCDSVFLFMMPSMPSVITNKFTISVKGNNFYIA